MQRLRRDDAAFHRRAAPLHRHHHVQKGDRMENAAVLM